VTRIEAKHGYCDEAASPALAALLRDDFVQAYERELPELNHARAQRVAPTVAARPTTPVRKLRVGR
jgi:hypothetical protein